MPFAMDLKTFWRTVLVQQKVLRGDRPWLWQNRIITSTDLQEFCSPAKPLIHSELTVEKTAFLNDLQEKLAKLLKNSPAADIERNIKTLVSQGLTKFELVTREEFEVQRELQARLRSRVDTLEERVKELENKRPI
jgi:BMFP domain-containing protein YqiC